MTDSTPPGDYRAPVPPFGRWSDYFGADAPGSASARLPVPAAPVLPADPFGMADDAGIALAEMYRSMLAGGIPLASVEKILGHMLASLPPGQD